MNKERLFLSFVLIIIILFTTIDIYADFQEGTSFVHMGIEMVLALSSVIGLIYLWVQYSKSKELAKQLRSERLILEEILNKTKQQSRLLMDGLSSYIDHEFNKWSLSLAERDISLLLLKGLGPKEIAELRNSSIKTVRHQISSIYKKAGFNSREELTAYFLEELFAPQENIQQV